MGVDRGHDLADGDSAWGVGEGCDGNSFLALEFEWIFWFSVTTAAALVALAFLRVVHLLRSSREAMRVPATLIAAKVSGAVALVALRLGILIVGLRLASDSAAYVVVSWSLHLAAACFLVVLLPLENTRRRRPSILACVFLFLESFYDIIHASTLWTDTTLPDCHEAGAVLAGLFTATLVVQVALLALESVRLRRWTTADNAEQSPEEVSSILTLCLYAWLNPLFWRGYHEPLSADHLFSLDRAISVNALEPRLESTKLYEPSGTSCWQLFAWLVKSLGGQMLLPVVPRLCLMGFVLSQPFFLQRLLGFLSSPEKDSSTVPGLVGISVLIYSGIAISTGLYWYYQERFQSLLRAFLVSAIYRKTTRLTHVGDGETAALTLMSADVERIYTGLRFMHEAWANTIQIALAAWMLQRQLGLAFLGPLIVVILCFCISFAVSRRAVPYQKAWVARVEKRIGVTSAVLSHVKELRVSGMVRPAADLVQSEREDEIRVGERSRVLLAITAGASQLPQGVAPAVTFAFGPHVLDVTHAYTALSFLSLLTGPLLMVIQIIPIIAASVACLGRIKEFLMRAERLDVRHLKTDNQLAMKTEKDSQAQDDSVVIEDGTYGWTADKHALKDINLSLPQSSITFVIGPVASGKSTLCRAILGEVPHTQGRMALKWNKLGYCDQVPFLFNASIMENIVGFTSFDTNRYSDVIQATTLTEDLKNLPAGDQTIVGTKGLSLSGGQRQRISLARALYQETEILVLDDVFSGLDGPTQELVCCSVLGPNGLVRRRGTTTIVCTHSTHLLSAADHIVALSQEGTIMAKTTYEEYAKDKSNAVQSIIEQKHGDAQASGTGSATASLPKTPTQKDQAPVALKHDKEVYRYWLSSIGVLPLVIYVVLVAGIGFFSNFPTIWLNFWSSDSVSSTARHSFAFWMGIYALLGAAVVLCVFPAGLIMLQTAVRLTGTELHRTTIDTVMRSSLRFLSSTDVGKVLNLFSQDTNIMDTQLPRMVNNMCICTALAIGQAAVIATSSAWLAISYPVLAAILWIVQRVYLPSSKRLRLLDLEAKTPLYFLDTIAGTPTLRAFGWMPHQLARSNALIDASQRPSYLLAMVQQWLSLTMNIVVAVLAVTVVVLATRLGSDAGFVGAGLVSLISLGVVLSTIVAGYTGLETSLGAISRLKSFAEETEQEGRHETDAVPELAWPTHGRITIQNVDASYNGTDRVLKGLTLDIPAKEKVAICGRTGSGKSSILSLLLRLIDPTSFESGGSSETVVIVDDLPIITIDRVILRERLICASQDAIFFPSGSSFRANLDPWDSASDEECDSVMQDLELSALLEGKGRLDAPLNSAELSGGQRQLLSVARAVLRRRVKLRQTAVDGGLLLLDEITASADADTERRVTEVLKREFANYTVLFVTHRTESVRMCQRVITVDAGAVVEDSRLHSADA